MATQKTETSSQNSQQTTPYYEPWQINLLNQAMGLFTGDQDGTYQAVRAFNEDPKSVVDFITKNPNSVSDPELRKILDINGGYYHGGGGSLDAVKKAKDYAKNRDSYIADYLKNNPSAIAQMGVGRENTEWSKNGGKIYKPASIEESPLFKAMSETAKRNSYWEGVAGQKRASANKKYTDGFDAEKDRTTGSYSGITKQYETDMSDLNRQDQNYRAGIDSELTGAIKDLLSENKISLAEARKLLSPVNLSYKDGYIPIVSKRQMALSSALSDLASEKYGTGVSAAKDIHSTDMSRADKNYGQNVGLITNTKDNALIGEEYKHGLELDSLSVGNQATNNNIDNFLTWVSNSDPNKPLYDYFSVVMPQANTQQQFGLSQGVTEGSGNQTSKTTTPGASLISQLASLGYGAGVGSSGISNLITAYKGLK